MPDPDNDPSAEVTRAQCVYCSAPAVAAAVVPLTGDQSTATPYCDHPDCRRKVYENVPGHAVEWKLSEPWPPAALVQQDSPTVPHLVGGASDASAGAAPPGMGGFKPILTEADLPEPGTRLPNSVKVVSLQDRAPLSPGDPDERRRALREHAYLTLLEAHEAWRSCFARVTPAGQEPPTPAERLMDLAQLVSAHESAEPILVELGSL
jgi:hypothetical protein